MPIRRLKHRPRCKGTSSWFQLIVTACAAFYFLLCTVPGLIVNTSNADFPLDVQLTERKPILPMPFSDPSWLVRLTKTPTEYCEGRVVVLDVKSISFYDAIVVPSRAKSLRNGGEKIGDVANTTESDEYFKYEPGFLKISCESDIRHSLRYLNDGNIHFRHLIDSIDYNNSYALKAGTEIGFYDHFVIALTRNDYANAYWVMLDLYSSFLTAVIHNKSPDDVAILLLDTHPMGHLDSLWTNLFKTVLRAKDLQGAVTFKHLTWKLPTNENPLLYDYSNFHVPYFTEFKEALLQSQNVSLNVGLKQRCEKSQLSVLFIWRHDYVAHPRNPSGKIKRKIINEQQLLRAAQEAFPRFRTRGMALESLTIPEQVALLASTDILIGMHGAGLALSVLMPSGGAVGELWPTASPPNFHMKRIAQASGLFYRQWQNRDITSEFGDRTLINVDKIISLIRYLIKDICTFDHRVRAWG